MKFEGLILALTVTLAVIPASAGQKGNGGDAIECKASGTNFPVDGLYVLDYAIMVDGQPWHYKGSEATHMRAIQQVFSTELSKQFPSYASSFNKFINEFVDGTNWIDVYADIVDIKDERLKKKIPSNCKKQMHQIAVQDNDNPWIFYYSENLEARLNQTDSTGLQLSIRNVHEMFRTVIRDASVIRKWVRLTHDASFFNLKGQSLVKFLQQKKVINLIQAGKGQARSLDIKANGSIYHNAYMKHFDLRDRAKILIKSASLSTKNCLTKKSYDELVSIYWELKSIEQKVRSHGGVYIEQLTSKMKALRAEGEALVEKLSVTESNRGSRMLSRARHMEITGIPSAKMDLSDAIGLILEAIKLVEPNLKLCR